METSTQRKTTLGYKSVDAAERKSAPEQNDQNNDHHYEADAPTIVMERRPHIESTAAKKENQNNQEQD